MESAVTKWMRLLLLAAAVALFSCGQGESHPSDMDNLREQTELFAPDHNANLRGQEASLHGQEAGQQDTTAGQQDQTARRQLRNVLFISVVIAFLLALVLIAVLWYALHLRNVKYRINREVSKAREMFFTNVTHEFRTPLTVILGLGHQLEGDDIQDMAQVRSAAKMIVRQGNSLLSLINQLLEVSKARLAATEPKWRHGNIVAFAEMVFDNFLPYANSKFIELTFSHSLTEIETDFVPDYVQKIISNMLSNAVKYTPKYGKVNMTLEQTANNRIKLQVFDTGCGIRPEAIPHVFEPFYQDDQSVKEVGTGIGLSIVKLMTEFMGGSVEVQSIVGQGSTFTVILPIMKRNDVKELDDSDTIDAPTMPDMSADETAEQPDETVRNSQKPRALIVEDNQDIAHYIGMQLQSRCQTSYARNGDEAMEKALEQIPDIVITDVMMPGNTDGLQLCRNIRQSELLCHIPIIIVTAKTTEQDRIKGLEAGADAYLVKPFNSEELLLRVRKLLERQQQLRERFAQLPPDATQREEQLSREDLRFLSRLADNVYKLMAQGKTDVETLAGEMCMTRSQLNRKVLAVTGQNVSAYMMRLRLARAKRLLKAEPGLSIGDVATKCGFDDLGYFSRIFRQNFNMTPSQYRRIE